MLSGINSNLNGDTASAIDRTIVNNGGDRNKASLTHAVYSNNPALVALCTPPATTCAADTVGYVATTNPNAYYIQANSGTLPTASRNTLPIRPIDNIDVTALKRISFKERYSFEVDATALNVLNHAQYIPGSIDTVNLRSTANVYAFNSVTNANFNNAPKNYSNNSRNLLLTAKIRF